MRVQLSKFKNLIFQICAWWTISDGGLLTVESFHEERPEWTLTFIWRTSMKFIQNWVLDLRLII